jgi:hypothetical protein
MTPQAWQQLTGALSDAIQLAASCCTPEVDPLPRPAKKSLRPLRKIYYPGTARHRRQLLSACAQLRQTGRGGEEVLLGLRPEALRVRAARAACAQGF